MKTKKSLLILLLASFIAVLATSCDPKDSSQPDENPFDSKEMLYHVWVPINSETAMGGDNFIVHARKDLTTGTINSQGAGKDVSTVLNAYFIVKDRNYYTINKAKQFAMYDSKLNEVKKIPMPNIKERFFCHAWINDNTLVLMGSNGEKDAVNWVKIDTKKMRILSEGVLALKAPADDEKISSSGMLAYRKNDNKLMYTYEYKAKKGMLSKNHQFHLAFINPEDMSIEKVVTENRAEFMASTAYGELRQDKSFMTKNGDYYIACNSTYEGASSYTQQHGALLRVNAGEMDFDKTYNGYTAERGKIITVNNLFNGKALLYMQDPVFATPDNPEWNHKTNPYVFYWIVLDLKTGEYHHLKDIPFSAGNFSQLAVIYRNKAYIGTNASDGTTKIYIYDIKTGKVSQGSNLAEGFKVERLVLLEDEK